MTGESGSLDVGDDLDVERPLWHVIRTHGRSQLPAFLVGGAASVVAIAFELGPSYLLGLAIDALFTNERAYVLPLVPASWIPAGTRDQFLLTAGLILGLYLAAAGLSWVNSWAWNRFAQHLQHEVRSAAYREMQELELAFFEDHQTGEAMSVLNNDVNQLEEFLTTGLNNAVRIATRVVVIAAVMAWLNWQLAAVALLVVPVLAVASHLFVRRIQPKYADVRSAVGSLNARLENNLGGVETVKAYANERFEADRVRAASRSYLEAQWDAISTRIAFFPTLRVVTAVGYVVTFLLGGWWVLFGPPGPFTLALSPGVLVTFLLYSRRFRYPMRRFGEILNDYQYAVAAAERVVALSRRDRAIETPEDPVALDDVAGRITYEGVTFAYPGTDEAVLSAVDVAVEPGEFVGLVGPTGAGKTTLTKLLLRFYDPDEGRVTLDGVDVRDLALSDLRSAVGYVSQEPFLFHGTVADNVAYGRPDADRERVEWAARQAGAHEFVAELPDGYDTVVGERGVKLSGGQRQRVAIARALVTDPDVLVLDEATSHVDNETEALIQRQLAELTADRTTIAVAHRLSTVRDADTIYVVDDGEIVERGTHEDLLAADGLYAALWDVQVGEVRDLPEEFVRRALRDDGRIQQD